MQLKSIFFVFLLSLMGLANAGLIKPCNSAELKTELIQLGLNPDIEVYEELLDSVESTYGVDIVGYLVSAHPALKEIPFGTVDPNTLQWVIEAIWSPKNPIARHMIIAIDLENESVLSAYVFSAFQQLYNPSEKTKLVFKNSDELKIFKQESIGSLRKLIEKLNPNISDVNLQQSISKFKQYYFSEEGSMIGLGSISYKNPVIVIEGHGNSSEGTGMDTITIGDITLTSDELVDILKSFELPFDSTLRLNSCFSGCTIYKIEKTTNEIRGLFKNNLLTAHSGVITGSLLDILSRKLYQTMPDFVGDVVGYIGKIHTIPLRNILRKDGTIMPKGYASEITGNDGVLLLKKEDCEVIIKRSDVTIP